MGGSSQAIASPLTFIIHKTTISRPTLPTLMWEGAKTSFDSTFNGNARVQSMIASLERSSSSEDDNDQERGGRRSSSPNKNQRHSTSYSPTKE
ncbi:hypothetical protein K443DRAFT_175233 [Laccaria amethystina LaAM-08-1]|uniref:Uncharacterized protein n=1 Tax=Laccaria amethystina LaAM-08-1 TaxID=1095629 RepID=A0A0C9XTN2_9AGAR|nr:hypothetical protein K443DRAFT_175233 [Laccaria amethystina LaAM-08-1]